MSAKKKTAKKKATPSKAKRSPSVEQNEPLAAQPPKQASVGKKTKLLKGKQAPKKKGSSSAKTITMDEATDDFSEETMPTVPTKKKVGSKSKKATAKATKKTMKKTSKVSSDNEGLTTDEDLDKFTLEGLNTEEGVNEEEIAADAAALASKYTQSCNKPFPDFLQFFVPGSQEASQIFAKFCM